MQQSESRLAANVNRIGDQLSGALQTLAIAKKEYEARIEGEDVSTWAGTVRQAIIEAAEITRTVADANTATIDAAKGAVQQLVQGSQDFITNLQGEVKLVVGSIRDQYTELTQTQGKQITATLTQLAAANQDILDNGLKLIVEDLNKSVGKYSMGAQLMSDSAATLSDEAKNLGRLGATADQIAHSADGINQQLTSFDRHQDDLISQFRTTANDTSAVATGMNTVVDTLNQQTADLARQVIAASEALSRFTDQNERTAYWLAEASQQLVGSPI